VALPAFKSLRELEEAVASCTRCPLHKVRRNPVPGEGPSDAPLMLVGEAPGAKEDEEGRPFVGRAGQLLNQLMAEVGLRREEAYITNIVKCRPPGNRDPTEEEKAACSPYLLAQISLIKPKVVVALGRHSASFLFQHFRLPWEGLVKQRGKPYKVDTLFHHFWLVATLHPAAALYRREVLPLIREDFRVVKALVEGRGPLPQ